MLLTLEVISPNGEALGANRLKTVGPDGVQIGRSKENDWIINDPYLSRVNARIRYVNGAFYIEGLGRNPLALNNAANVVANNEPQLLRNGDRFFLDQYEIRATVAAGRSSTAVHDDPFSPGASAIPRVPDVWAGGSAPPGADIRDGQAEDPGNLDPLAALGGAASHTLPPPRHIDLDQRSVLDDSLQLQPPQAPRSVPGGAEIPDTWDRSRLTKMDAPPPKTTARSPTEPPKRSAPPPPTGIPDAWDRTNFEQRAPLRPVRPDPRPAPTIEPAQVRKTLPPHTVRRPLEQPATTEVMRPAPATAETQAAQAGAAGSHLSLEHLLQAAGVPATHMSPEMAAELGQVLRIVVQGVMEVLQSRAEIKSQLRMSMTRMQPTENNPLKFSPNVEAALHTLLVERNRGYLPATRAFEEALIDIRNHQIAVLQGIRVAFDSMLEKFDPERIEEEIERGSKRGLLNVGAKSRFRDHYVEQFQKLTSDRDESFRRLFGEQFAQAYEEQMDRLKAAARTSGG